MDADLAFAGALEQRRLMLAMLAMAVSPRELAEWYLERIDAPLHSYLTVTPERAARGTGRRGRGDARRHAGAEDTRGARTTRGSLIFRNYVPSADAPPRGTTASVPCGFTAAGLPVGLQIIGRFGDDAGVIAASAAFETVRPWAYHRPPGL